VLVALAEIGDKTQLLAFLLAAKFKRPMPIIAGILLATIANHALAGSVGLWLSRWLSPELLRWLLGGSFLIMAAWMLIPDKLDDNQRLPSNVSVLLTTTIAFFLAEMGDKTQVATIALAAKYQQLWVVTLGTTTGMMLANVPAVLFGERLSRAMPAKLMHRIVAVIFALLAALTLLKVDRLFQLGW
jgi:Ca2+/H+ antiporter, TMEM165/GDT1 family